MKRLPLWMTTIAGLLLCGPALATGVSGNVGVASEYLFRGIPMSDGAAIQGGLDYAGQNGGYAGVWASNVNYDGESGGELDLYGSFPIKPFGLDLELGAIAYLFSETRERDSSAAERLDYAELVVGGHWGPVTARLFYSPDYFNSSKEALYFTASSSFRMTPGTQFFLQAGALDWKVGERYVDYSLGFTTTTRGGLSINLGAYGTARRDVSSPAAGPLFPASAGGSDDVRYVISARQVFDLN